MSDKATALVGKSAVILGASSPHGAATARVLAREGVNLALGGRDRERLEALGREAEALGGRAIVVGTHLAKRHHPVHLVQAAFETFGGLDFLLLMARRSAPPLGSLDLDAWEASVDVNVKGFLYTVAAALPIFKTGGHVISVDCEDRDSPDPLFRASRAAVRVLLQEMGREFSSRGLRASELKLGDPRKTSPERCAETVRRMLLDPRRTATTGFSTREVPSA